MFPIDTTLPWTNPHNIKIDNDKTINNSKKDSGLQPSNALAWNDFITKNDGNPKCWYTATGIRGPLYTLITINIIIFNQVQCFGTMIKVRSIQTFSLLRAMWNVSDKR